MRFDRCRRERLEDEPALSEGSDPPLAGSLGNRSLRDMGWISAECYAEARANPAVRELIALATAIDVPRAEGSRSGPG
jgi:hypothetical protein